MTLLTKWALRLCLAFACAPALSQLVYDDIVIGQVLKGSVGLGGFANPLPLPNGEWRVAGKRIAEVKLDNGRSVPRYFLTLKSDVRDNTIAAIVLAYSQPAATSVNWINEKCASSDTKVLVDDFGLSSTDLLYLCSKTYTYADLRRYVTSSESSSNGFAKSNLPALIPYAQELPIKAILIVLTGNRYRDRQVTYNFYMRRDSDVLIDPAYRAQISSWANAAGLVIRDILEGKSAVFAPPPREQTISTQFAVQPPTNVPAVEPAKARADEAFAQEASQLQRDREKHDKERKQLENEKREFERQKLAAQKEHERKLEQERIDLASRAKSLCLRSYNTAISETALRQFIQDFPDDECGQQTAAKQKLADLEEKRLKANRDKDRERQTKQEQARALLGSTVQYQETFKPCLTVSTNGPCQPVAFRFTVKGKIFDLDIRRTDAVQIEITEVTLIGPADDSSALPGSRAVEQADVAFRQKMVGNKFWRSKAELGIVF